MQMSVAKMMCCSMCQAQVSADRGFFGKRFILERQTVD